MKFSLGKLNDMPHVFITKRGRMIKLVLAIVAVALLCVILSGLMLIQLPSNQPTSGENPNQVVPNYPTNKPISDVGSLKTIGIEAYWDADLTNRVNVIDWGLLEPGDQKSFSIYLHNEGNSAVTLSMSTSNWNPSVASTYLTLSWDYNGQAIKADQDLQVTLTLSASESITGITDFGFDIIIVGTGRKQVE